MLKKRGTQAILIPGTSGDDTLIGTPDDDTIDAGAGNDTLIGEGGTDTLIGGTGNDNYRVETMDDIIVEAVGEGIDAAYAVTGYVLRAGAEVETLSAIDPNSAGDMDLTGNEFANTLIGTAGSNTLIGGGGADVLAGGGGRDYYRVEEAADEILEYAGGGFDSVYATTSYTLRAGYEIELLAALGAPPQQGRFTLTGNEYANTIIGSTGGDHLIGGGGDDVMAGGLGNDDYRIEESGDVILEYANGGFDQAFVGALVGSWAVRPGISVEEIRAIDVNSTVTLDLTGNEFNQTIVGSAGSNTIIGGGGVDILYGFGGNDFFRVENSGTSVVEAGGGGTDAVYATVSYALSVNASVELLQAIDPFSTAAINLAGNGNSQTLIGNAGINQLTGGSGADVFAFISPLGPGNIDVITDMVSGTDLIVIDNAQFTGMAEGLLAAGAFVLGSAALDADDRILYNQATGAVYFDADGNGTAAAAVQFLTLQTMPAIVATDFFVL
ncbi:MAG: hypothetical protein QOD42_120 [Sphingomonadales bacterium]|jgi:serralysin|nr:hypothetical protein [Sphingomonadales bacterium]